MIIGISGKINSGKDTVGKMILNIMSTDFKPYEENKRNNLISNWKAVKFADTLKDMTCVFFNCTREDLESRTFKESPRHMMGLGITPREFMQKLGTEFGRDTLHPEIWSKRCLSEYKVEYPDYTFGGHFKKCVNCGDSMHFVGKRQLYCKGCCDIGVEPNWIITDVRFPEEVEAIKKLGGVVWRVNRPGQTHREISVKARRRFLAEEESRGLNLEQISKNSRFLEIFNEEMENHNPHESETALDNYENFDEIIENDGTLEDLESYVVALLLTAGIVD